MLSITNLKELLNEFFKRHNIEGKIGEQLLVTEWDKEAPELALGAKPLYVKDRVLYLGTYSHAIAQELNLRKKELLDELRSKGYDLVDIKLQFVLPEGRPETGTEPLKVEVTREDREWAREALAHCSLPPKLREKMEAMLAAARARERAALSAGGKRCPSCGTVFFGEGKLCPICRIGSGVNG